eukprot:772421-Rhodomonas_salina.1
MSVFIPACASLVHMYISLARSRGSPIRLPLLLASSFAIYAWQIRCYVLSRATPSLPCLGLSMRLPRQLPPQLLTIWPTSGGSLSNLTHVWSTGPCLATAVAYVWLTGLCLVSAWPAGSCRARHRYYKYISVCQCGWVSCSPLSSWACGARLRQTSLRHTQARQTEASQREGRSEADISEADRSESHRPSRHTEASHTEESQTDE